MFGFTEEDEAAVIDPIVPCPEELIEQLQDINGSVLKEVLIEKIKQGVTKRQLELLKSVLFISDN